MKKLLALFDGFKGFLDKKVTRFGISIALLMDFVCLFTMALCMAVGAKVDRWSLMFVLADTVWSYLSEKKQDKTKVSAG